LPARVLAGAPGSVLGPRLVDAEVVVDVQRHEAPGALWLDLAHHGWMARYGTMHQRRLYLDTLAGELRGEDRLTPTARAQGPDGRHFIPYALRFPLHAGVRALVSQDRRSVLLRLEGEADGWILRNDALDIALEPRAGGGAQLVLRGQRRADSGARVRWKLAPARQLPAEAGS
ncbi:MAG: heparinase II/III family protein, partial [Phenylobacterium sp.]|nr:heparinase II/III family protein [Phenylobacterium sp.]